MLSGSRSDFGIDGHAPSQLGDAVRVEATAKVDGTVVVPDAHLLFSGDFTRSGLDLEISRDDRHFLVRDYFKGEHRAGLASPDGAWLTGDIVNALTGHTQFAQADGSASAGKVIGHITKLAGSATVIRNGVSIVLNLGDNVEKGDVVQSGSDSKLGITFIDGTVFGLASNARMVLNEMIYDPNGSNNSSLISLVAGTITFVAGQTAKHGDMKVDTPVATMGIRGTAVLVQIDFDISGASGVPDAKFQVLVEPDGTTGSYLLLDKTTLTPLATVNQSGQVVSFSQGALGFGTASPLSTEVQQLITDVFALKFTNANPKTLNQFTDSIVPDGLPHTVFASGDGTIPTFSVVFGEGGVSATATYQTVLNPVHYDVPPTVTATPGAFTVRSGAAHRGAIDSVSGTITFEDVNLGDRPTVTAHFDSFKVLDAQGNDITATLTAKQLAAIAAVEAQLVIAASPDNTNAGIATYTYSVADRAFDFLGAGRTLVLTYQAQVDTNYSEYNTTVLKPLTITISSPHVVEWIFPSDGLWSIGSNWKTGLVPTGLDDVVIPAQEIVGGTGHYTVTIITPAEANSVSLDAADTTGAQLINNSTLAISNALTLFSESAFHNFGVASIGLIELLDQSALDNSGLITLTEGGDFVDQSSVTNNEAGILELAGGLLNVTVNIANAGFMRIDPGANLTLGAATINGAIENRGVIDLIGAAALTNGSLSNFGLVDVSGNGNALHNEIVSNFGSFHVTGELILDLDTTITGGIFSNSGIVRIEGEQGATLHGVDVENFSGAVQIATSSALVVDGGTIINGGALTIGSLGTFEVAAFSSAMLGGGVNVFNSGTVEVNEGSTLYLLGSTISGGVVSDNGTLRVLGDSAINAAAIFGGLITVDPGKTLTLDDSTVTDSTVTDNGVLRVDAGHALNLSGVFLSGGIVVNLGLIDIIGDSSISSDTMSNAQLTIASDTTLTLNGTIILGGIVTDNGIIHVTGDSAINNAAIVGGQIIVDDGFTLTLNGTTVTDTVIADDGTIQIDVNQMRLLDGVALSGGTINNFGTLKIIGDSSISDDILNNHQLTIDLGKTLTLSETIVTGGTVTDNGSIHVAGNSAINSAAVNGGQVTVDPTRTLTLDNTTVTGTTIADNGTVKVDSGNTLNLSGVPLSGGAISNLGLIDIIGDSSISNDALTNVGQLKAINNSILELTNTIVANLGGAITVTSGSTLDLDNGASISDGTLGNAGEVNAEGTTGLHHLGITNTGTLESTSGVLTIDGGSTINNSGTLQANGGELDLTNDTLTNTNALKAINNSILELTNTIVANLGGAITVTAGSTLDLDNGASISDGTLGNAGEVNAEGTTGLHHLGITNTGTLESTSGLLTIDGGSTINNSGTLQANGGELDLTNDTLTNTNALKAINNSILELTNTIVANLGGAITVTAGSTLDLDNGASISDGTLGNAGEVNAEGTTGLHHLGITNTGTLESTSGLLTIDGGSTINNSGTLQANGGELDLTNDTLTNTNALKAINNSILELTNTIVANLGGVITVTAGSTLDLDNGASISDGTLGNAGEVNAEGTTGLHHLGITNTGTLESTSGLLTIDGGSTINNSGTLQANGGELDLTNDTLTNTNALKAINNSILELTNTIVANLGGAITVTSGSTLDLDNGASISDGTLGNAGEVNAEGTTGLHHLGITNTGTLESTSGLLTIDGGSTINNSGTLQANGGELDLTNDTLTNTNALKAINNSILELTNTIVANLGGVITVTAGSTLDLDNGASISDGTLGNAGEVNAEGTTGLHHLGITNTGTLESTSGLLTIDGGSTINNSGTLQANGGELDLTNDTLTNINALKATNNSILELTNTIVANLGGAITVTSGSTLDLDNGASISDGTLGNAGEVNAEGTTGLHHLGITNTGTLESTSGLLTIDGGSTINNSGTLQANGGELDLTNDTLTNTNALKAINNSILELTNTIVANLGGAITVTAGSTLDLDNGASISDGTLGNAGEVNAEGTTGLHHLGITNTGTLESTSGLLTIDGGSTINNSGTLQANGGELDLTNDTLTNTNALKAINNSILELTNTIVANLGGAITVTSGSTLDLDNGASISDGTLGNAGEVNAEGTTGLHHLGITNTGTLESTSGLLTIDGGSTINNSGTLQANGGELDLTNDTLTNTNALKAINNSILELTNTIVANLGGVITVTAGSTLDLDNGASISDGTLGNAGEVNAEGTTGLHHLGITNTGTLESTSGLLTIDGGSTINNSGTLQANGGELDLTNDTLTNTNALKAINNSILELTNTIVANLGGAITVTSGSTLDLDNGASISDGTLGNAGEVNAEGTTGLHHLGITNTGTLESTSGLLTIDGGSTINNSGTLQANGGELDLTNDTLTNTNALKAINNSILELTGTTVTNADGTVTADAGSTLTLATSTITGGLVTGSTNGAINLNGLAVFANGSLSNSGQINVSGTGNALHNETVTSNHLLEIVAGGALLIDQGSTIANSGGTVQVDFGGTLTLNSTSLLTAIINGGTVADYGAIYVINTVDISGNIIGAGAINIDDWANLEIGGSVEANTVFFTDGAGGQGGELILDQSKQFSGLISGSSVGTLLTLDDQMDLRDLAFNLNHMSTTVSYNSSLDISTVTFSDGAPANNITIHLSGDYTHQGWLFTDDGFGGSLVQLAPPPVFSDVIGGLYAFTGNKTASGGSSGSVWTFQAAVTDVDANVIGQGGITKFELYDTHVGVTTLIGSATWDGHTWTVSGIFSSVSFTGGILLTDGFYTITTAATDAINNNDTLKIIAYDAANLSATESVTLTNNASFDVKPAGIAGEPINLALTDPSDGQSTGPIELTITGVPSDWSINEGTNLGNGTWTIETNDLTALTVTTAAGYTGAMVLGVTETWKNADGSTGTAVVSDNVEAFAPGSPIFALSGDDTLTGASQNDLFVFAQPIGHDTVYSFDAGHDQIDLIGYAGFTSFVDIQAHLTENANGNALITLGDGQSIELQGVHAAALTQGNFVFDQMPTLDNAGTMTIGDGAVMPLSGTINNTGTIALNSTGDETDLQLIEHGVTLQGGGTILLSDSDLNVISGTSSTVTLDNEDNTISGAGSLGNGELSLTNAGTINATETHALVIDTGSNVVVNSGTLEASGSGGLMVLSAVENSGFLWANGAALTIQGAVTGTGTATIDGTGTLDFEASSTARVVFGSGTGGTLKLGDAFHFDGTITGFDGADVIDLENFDSGAATISYHANAGGTGGTLTISDGAHIAELSLVGNYSADNFSLAADHLKGTSITYLAHDLVV